jgi:CheY-like chemotaxis protein
MRAIGRADMPLEVLLVDDNPGDVRLVQEAFRDVRDTIHLHVAVDGVDALTFLRQEGEHANSPRPDFILLDITCQEWVAEKFWLLSKRTRSEQFLPPS